MFSKILVANRGEIALRIIRACKELGIRSVGVYSEADRDCLHLALADERICIGPAASIKSYLNMDNILNAAKETESDAIHPGYGYLAENSEFARRCSQEGITFIGPTPENIRLAGDKIAAKQIMAEAGVPVIPSSPGGVDDVKQAIRLSREIGYPVMIKASGGGGGRGIRICKDEDMIREEFPEAKMEAHAAFGNDQLYIEKFIEEPRHIEFQILADRFGSVIHLGERECTIQRRYQKLIEEAPSPMLTPGLRDAMGKAAITAAKAVDYFNAGTIEFLVDKNGQFYFMEINSRIQVEHPVTEFVTGIDLVKAQIRLASGERLNFASEIIKQRGCAIECRINAEDPDRNFMPSPGKIERFQVPGGFGVRLDTHLYQGYEIPIYYDSLIGKLISYDLTRDGAIQIMKRALSEIKIEPIKTTIPLHIKIMDDPLFQSGTFSTNFIERYFPQSDDEDDEE
ncbi:MAG: acetyl-CoA carboxylase biotin carboxylase subunit [Pseudomonadota bacterium]